MREPALASVKYIVHTCRGWFSHRPFLRANFQPHLSSETSWQGFGWTVYLRNMFHTCQGWFSHGIFLQANSHPHLSSETSWQGFGWTDYLRKFVTLAKNGSRIDLFYRLIPTLIYPVNKDSGGRCTWRICFTLAKAGSCIVLFYRIIPTLIYLVKSHDKDSMDGALEEYVSHLTRLVLA